MKEDYRVLPIILRPITRPYGMIPKMTEAVHIGDDKPKTKIYG